MKNHFFFSYAGNKRQEVEHIYTKIDFNNIDTIIEPFCGSCALSFFIWSQNKNKNYKYILNDLDDNLIKLLRIIKDNNYKDVEDNINKVREEILNNADDINEAKSKYLKYLKNKDLNAYIFKNKYYSQRPGLFPIRDFKSRFNIKLDFKSSPIFEFLTTADIEIYNEYANIIIDKYDNPNSFIFLDPPYIASCNSYYKADSGNNINNIYMKLCNYGLKNFNSKILICHENNWLFKIIFKEYITEDSNEYKITYQNSLHKHMLLDGKKKKETTHICIVNY
jgi:site-specific DNA-adenine methylase